MINQQNSKEVILRLTLLEAEQSLYSLEEVVNILQTQSQIQNDLPLKADLNFVGEQVLSTVFKIRESLKIQGFYPESSIDARLNR